MGQDPARRAEVRGRGLGARQRPSAVPEGDRPTLQICKDVPQRPDRILRGAEI